MGSWACKSGSPKMHCLPTRVRLRASTGQPLKFMERLSALLRKHARILMCIIGVVQEDEAGSQTFCMVAERLSRRHPLSKAGITA